MDSAFISAIDGVASRHSLKVVDEQTSPPDFGLGTSQCLLVAGLRLCALIVPNRHEIEVWLEDKSDPNWPSFSTGTLSAALGQPPAAIMFKQAPDEECLGKMVRLLEGVASNLLRDKSEFLDKLRAAQDKYSSREHEMALRRKGDAARVSGNRHEAAEAYKKLAEPSLVELKRIELASRTQSSSSS